MAHSTYDSQAGFAPRLVAFVQRHLVLASLVTADVVTKVLAFRLLPGGDPLQSPRGFGFYLTLNEWGVLGGVEGVGAVTANSVYTSLLAVALLGLAFMVRKLDTLGLSFPWRLLAGTVVFLVVSNVVQVVARPFAHVALPPDLVISAIRGSALAVSLAFYSVSRSLMARLAFTLLGAGSLSNALSYAYPPFDVVDFMRVPLPGYVDVFGVINVADVYIALALVAMLAWPLVALAGWGTSLTRRRPSARRARGGRLGSDAAAESAD